MLRSSKLQIRRFHITSKLLLRKIGPRTSSNVGNHEFSVKNSDLSSDYESTSLDYLGIESEENLVTVTPQKHRLQQPQISESTKEKFYRASFGIVRFDADNKLKYHGQHKNKIDFTFPHSSSGDVKVSNISEISPHGNKILQNLFFENSQIESSNDTLNNKTDERLITVKNDIEENYIEECYFGSSKADDLTQNNAQPTSEELNYLEKDYFENLMHSANTSFENNSEHPDFKTKIDSAFHNNNLIEKLNNLKEKSIKCLTSPENSKTELDSTVYSSSKKLDSSLGDEEQSDELNYLDKNYFRSLSNLKDHHVRRNMSYNTDYEKEIDSTLDRNKQNALSKHSSFIPSIDELNLPDKSTYETCASSNYQNSRNYDDLLNTSSDFEKEIYKSSKDISKKSNQRSQNIEPDSIVTDYSIDELKELTQKENFETNFKKLSFSKTQKADIMPSKNTQSLDKKSDLSKEISKEADESFSIENNFKFSNIVSQAPDQNDEMSTAHDFVQKLREQQKVPSQIPNLAKGTNTSQEKFDSKGFRILKDQVPNLAYFTHDEILNILKQNVVYSDDDLLILNKPYNLVIHESKTTKEPCLSTFLDDLAKELDKQSVNPKLFTVHRLDKETTGCLMLARNETMAMHLKSLLAQRQIVKKYWIITCGVPDPPEGVIDIPISEGSVNNRKRMVLNPKLPSDIPYRNHSKSGKPAVTTYKVISDSGSAALVEVFPKTGVKHQIRVHFGFGLGCPILGDHKYSHLDKLVPQKLPCDMLQKLHVRQSKVRYIPMHIHAKSVGIPEYFDKRDLFVNIPIPDYFKLNLKRLKFRKKDMKY